MDIDINVKELANYARELDALYVEDDNSLRDEMSDLLSDFFKHLDIAANGSEGYEKYRMHRYDLVISDIRMPIMDGIEMVKKIKKINSKQAVIIYSAYDDSKYLMELINTDIDKFLLKPLEGSKLLEALRDMCKTISEDKTIKETAETASLSGKAPAVIKSADIKDKEKQKGKLSSLIGISEKMQSLHSLIDQLSSVKTTVLITGESGTGKELVAEAIHYKGTRKEKPLVKVNCASLSESLLESELFGYVKGAFTGALRDKIGRLQKAHNGTLFLDEIGNLSLHIQAKLLRALQSMEFERVGDASSINVDVRVIAATNTDLSNLVKQGSFRQDLLYRIRVVELKIPPLRERTEDIPLLVEHFIKRFRVKIGKNIRDLSPNLMDMLIKYRWSGNVRELEHLIEHAFILCRSDTITINDLPEEFVSKFEQPPIEQSCETKDSAQVILKALEQTRWNKTKAAKLLGIDRSTLYLKMQKFNLK
ncbi:two component, sigma54 specific, transcriptional regulator, Fis family [Candidatus Magnetoovum chiemensis]|nr:two component, sigma54 specific, transcriptional regulator, Fis family [Candidatus Magnetoovum chiemensis]